MDNDQTPRKLMSWQEFSICASISIVFGLLIVPVINTAREKDDKPPMTLFGIRNPYVVGAAGGVAVLSCSAGLAYTVSALWGILPEAWRSFVSRKLIIGIIGGSVIAGFFIWGIPILEQLRPEGPHGEMIPAEPPQEANRVFHANGLSIIAPKNWNQPMERASSLVIAARGTPGRRLRSAIFVNPTAPPNLTEFTTTTLNGLPAYEKMEVMREDTFDDPASSRYQLYVDDSGQWWNVTFLVQDSIRTLPAGIRQYIDTIRFPAKEIKAPHEPAPRQESMQPM